MSSPPQKNPSPNLGDRIAAQRAAALVGTVLSGRYRVVDLLAMGGVGAVYLGEHVKMHKQVAIKVLHPDAQSLPELAARFEREAVAGSHIQHPNVASATDFGELEDGSHFLVLEYVRGATLREVIRRGPVSPARAVGIARQIAAGLSATHAVGIVHRDLKPRNVMLIEGERDLVKIIDFGLAKLNLKEVSEVAARRASMSDHQITGTGAVFGTIAYLAPEAALGMDSVDARADLYAFGLVLYEMLAGKHPFLTSDPVALFKHHARTPPPPIAERSPGVTVPPALEALVMRLLEKRREDRHPSAEAVLRDLEAVFEGALTPTPSPVSIGDGVFPGPSILPPPPVSQPPSRPASQPAFTSPVTAPPPSVSPTPPSAIVAVPDLDPPPPAVRHPRVARARWPWVAGGIGLALGALAIGWPRDHAVPVPAAATTLPPASTTLPPAREPASTSVSSVVAASVTAAPSPSLAATSAPSAALPASPTASADPAAPFDGTVARATLRRAAAARDHAHALEAFLALAEREPAALAEPAVALAARDLAAAIAVAGGDGADRLFDLLGHHLGGAGLDVLYEIVRVRGGSKAAARAEPILREPGAMGRATPALRVTFALREATCADKPALLDRAVAEGDLRTLMVMESNVLACVGPRHKPLEAAIKALRQRVR